jgi:hypothetical protein
VAHVCRLRGGVGGIRHHFSFISDEAAEPAQ